MNAVTLITEQEAATSTTPAEIPPKIPPDPTDWTIENVISYISYSDPPLGIHGDLFRRHVSFSSGNSTYIYSQKSRKSLIEIFTQYPSIFSIWIFSVKYFINY